MRTTVALLALLLPGLCWAEDKLKLPVQLEEPPENIQEYFDRCEAYLPEYLGIVKSIGDKLQKDWAKAKRGIINKQKAGQKTRHGLPIYADAKTKARAVEKARQQVFSLTIRYHDLKAKTEQCHALMDAPLKVGKIGELPTVKLTQVIDGSSALLDIDGESAWVDDFNTAGLTDDARVTTTDDLYQVVGTKQYTTALGTSRTVAHLKLFDKEELNRYREPDHNCELSLILLHKAHKVTNAKSEAQEKRDQEAKQAKVKAKGKGKKVADKGVATN